MKVFFCKILQVFLAKVHFGLILWDMLGVPGCLNVVRTLLDVYVFCPALE